MYKLMIADDEQIVLSGLSFLIEEEFTDIDIVATVTSGREAVEQCHRVIPDIVLMDIKMPGINGIEAIELIQQSYPHIKFVVISAYEQFEFAKQAVQLGVSDYMLKPVNRDKLVEILKKLIKEIEMTRQQQKRELLNKEKLDKVIPILEQGFIYALLLNSGYPGVLDRYQELFEVNKNKGYVMTIELGEQGEEKGINKIGSSVKGQASYTTIHELIKYKCKCIIGPLIINRITLLVFEDSNKELTEFEQRIMAIDLSQQIKQEIEKVVDISCSIGIGAIHPLESCRASLEESLSALMNCVKGEAVLHINDLLKVSLDDQIYTYSMLKADEEGIIQLIESGDEEELLKKVTSFLSSIEKQYKGDVERVRNVLIELMVMVISCSYKRGIDGEEIGYTTYLDELNRMTHMVTLKNWCIQKVQNICQLIKNTRTQRISQVVLDAQTYIDEHYAEDITLIDVSKIVAVSPQYFSKIFKEEIGVSYVEYVRNKRIAVAKELLKDGKYSVKEICYKIGYNDPNYFSRLFKKLIGVSPTEYK